MRDKFLRFMQGRYGVDTLSRFMMVVALICVVVASFTGSSLLSFAGFALLIYIYFRMFSRDISRRYEENQKFLQSTSRIRDRFHREKYLMEQRKTNHIYTCSQCGQKIRIPKGKGKIEITCPKCHNKFIKRS